MDPRKDNFWNGCTQESCGARMCATRRAILTDARNGLLGNGYAQGMGQIADARNLHSRCKQPLKPPNKFRRPQQVDPNKSQSVAHFLSN